MKYIVKVKKMDGLYYVRTYKNGFLIDSLAEGTYKKAKKEQARRIALLKK